MNKKGFVGFVLILAIITILLFFTITLNQNKSNLNQMKNELMKAETSNMKRTIIENNIDKIIEKKLEEQITLKNFNTLKAKLEINTELSKYLIKNAKVYSYNGETSEVTLYFLNQNSTVQLLKSQYFIYAEYVYAPTFTTTKIKQTFGNKLISEFIFPSNYTKTIIRAV